MAKANSKKRRGVLESFLRTNYDENTLKEASELATEVAAPRVSETQKIPQQNPNQVSENNQSLYQSKDYGSSEHNSEIKTEQTIEPTQHQFIPEPLPEYLPELRSKIHLSPQHTRIYDYLAERREGFTSVRKINKSTGVPINTIYKGIRKLREIGLINYRKENSNWKGLVFKVNTQIEVHRSEYLLQPNDCGAYQSICQNNYHSNQSLAQSAPIISSSSFNNNSTTKADIQNNLLCHPELGYWRQKGLTARQLEQWTNVAQCSLENMIQYLCYCRFEMVDLGMEESKPVDNVFNWFFRIIERTGAYPKPNGYKSHQEKQLETERQAVEQRERAAQEAEELYRRKIEADRKREFWDMMNDPEGDLYKQCFDSLNKIQKRRTSGKGFEMSMRAAFDKLMDGEDEIQ